MNDMLADSFSKRKADKTTFPVEDGFEYSVWVSYAEIYNEKIYDLLETPPASQSNGQTVITRKALSLKKDSSAKGCKYIHGLKEVRIRSAEEAQVILRRGQINRRVFSTLSNRESSRSHGVFAVKILRLPINNRTGKVMEVSRNNLVWNIPDFVGLVACDGIAPLRCRLGRFRAHEKHSYLGRPPQGSWKYQQVTDGAWSVRRNSAPQSDKE